VLRKYLNTSGTKQQKAEENYILWAFIICTIYQTLLRWSNQGG